MNSNENTVREKSLFTKFSENKFTTLTKFVIGIGLLFYIIEKVNFNDIINNIKNVDFGLLLAAMGLTFINISLQYFKWKLTSKTILSENNNKKILYSLFYGISAGAFTPARVGEYFGRAVEFKDKPFLQVSAATFVDKIFTMLMVLFWGMVASMLFLRIYYNVTFYTTVPIFTILFAFIFTTFSLLQKDIVQNFFKEKLSNRTKLKKWAINLKVLKNLDKKFSYKMLFLAFLLHVCYIMQFAILTSAFSKHSDWLNFIWAGNLVMFAKTIIPAISLGDLGIREGASVFFIKKIGYAGSVGFNASLALFFINILFPALIGLILLPKKNND